jgi:flagellar protein FlbD
MIQLTRINQTPIVLNSDLIEHVEVTPDTVVTLTGGQKFLVLESPQEVIARVIAFRRSLLAEAPLPGSPGGAAGNGESERGKAAR